MKSASGSLEYSPECQSHLDIARGGEDGSSSIFSSQEIASERREGKEGGKKVDQLAPQFERQIIASLEGEIQRDLDEK